MESSPLLGNVPLFAAVRVDRFTRLYERSLVRNVRPGEVVVLRGQNCTHLIVVESGALTAVRETADGSRMRIGEYSAPCAVDKTAVLDGGGHTATWVAAQRTVLRLVPVADVLAVIDDIPAVRRHVLAHLAEQVRDRQDDLVRASFGNAVMRTAAWLTRAAGDGETRIELPGAQQGLAEHIGMSRVSVNRALASLARDGLIRIEPKVIVIKAPELLAQRALQAD